MPDFKGRHGHYVDVPQEYVDFLKEVDQWDIVPLEYRTPQHINLMIAGQEFSLFDSSILRDTNLSDLELRLMINICNFYPVSLMELCTFEGVNGYVIQGLHDEYAVRDMVLSLRDRGYLCLDTIDK